MRKAIRRQLAQAAPLLFHLLAFTWRIRTRGPLPPQAAVIAFWHGDMLPVWKHFSHQGWVGLASQSRDGSLITRLLESWGYRMIRGSSSKFTREVWSDLVTSAKKGRVFITPDGPRGPVHRLKPGAVMAAQRAGVPLWLCRVHSDGPAIHGTNWDSFLIPLFFCRITLEFEPFPLPEKASKDEMDALVAAAEDRLNHRARTA